MRLYRGLKEPHDPARVPSDGRNGTDFTDCPYAALGYATGRKGVMLVLDVPDDSPRVREEFWFVTGPRRFMIWGAFDEYIVATIPAKELRAEVRRKGIVTLGSEDKGMVLRGYIERRERDVVARVAGG